MHMLNIVKFTMGLLLTLGIQPNPVHCADPVLVVVESSQEVVLATLLRAIAKFDCIDQLSPIQLQRLENRPPLLSHLKSGRLPKSHWTGLFNRSQRCTKDVSILDCGRA